MGKRRIRVLFLDKRQPTASFVPDMPRANTHLTTLAVAERLAERV